MALNEHALYALIPLEELIALTRPLLGIDQYAAGSKLPMPRASGDSLVQYAQFTCITQSACNQA